MSADSLLWPDPSRSRGSTPRGWEAEKPLVLVVEDNRGATLYFAP